MGGVPWTEHELAVAVDETFTIAEAAEIIRRTPSVVEHARARARIGDPVLMRPGWRQSSPHTVADRRVLARTCTGCGMFLDARFFGVMRYKNGRVVWRTQCAWCRSRTVVARRQARRAEAGQPLPQKPYARGPDSLRRPTENEAPRHGYLWTGKDYAVASNPAMTIEQKAYAAGRTWAAMRKKCTVHGYRSLSPLLLPNQDEGQWLLSFEHGMAS